ncbi:MAG: DUF4363 family protein [Oscillospiraceae bacterium]|nr:DUF4363 family protein [Oscillospiraceae bacterium]
MSRLYISVGLITVMLIICITSIASLAYYRDMFIEVLDSAYAEFIKGDYDDVYTIVSSFEHQWEKSEKILMLFASQIELDEVAKISSALKYYITYEDYSMFCSELSKAKNILEHLYKSKLPTIWTVL